MYGNLKELPVTEESPLSKAESPYGNTKQICEEILTDFSKISDMNIVLLRYFNPVGCHESGLIGDLHKESVINMICKSIKENKVFNLNKTFKMADYKVDNSNGKAYLFKQLDKIMKKI